MSFVLLFIFILISFCNKSDEKKLNSNGSLKQDYFYVYDNLTIESYCHFSKKVLYCDGKNDSTLDFKNKTFDNVKLCLDFPQILKKGKLLIRREADIKTLMFFNNSITYIDDGTFDNFPTLETLWFWHTNLSEITEKVLTEKLGSHLKYLSLGYNNIAYISSSAFKFMINLNQLSLAGNKNIEKFINKKVFSKSLMKIEILNLSDCNITVLNDDAFVELQNLDTLILSHNPFTSIPRAINVLSNIYYISFESTNITSFIYDKELFNNKLGVLSVSNSEKLTYLGDCAFCNFPNLWLIELSCNSRISYIHPNAFGTEEEMAELCQIKMESINVSVIPKELFKRKIDIVLHNKYLAC